MSALINDEAIRDLVTKTLQMDMNDCLEKVTKDVVAKLEETVRHNVAARMIALCHSDYNMEYMRGELIIRVKMETNK